MRYAMLALALVFFFVWIGAFVMFHVAGAMVHILLFVALILFVSHLFVGRQTA
jgi:hypothetical protein